MQRRDLLKLGGVAFARAGASRIPVWPQVLSGAPGPGSTKPGTTKSGATVPGATGAEASAPEEGKADFTLRIAPVAVELDPSRILSTIGYNGQAPGPVLRMREGKTVTVDLINDTDTPEFVHWHGMLIPAEVDGTEEEGSPLVPPHGRHRIQLTPGPAGSRWYHSHAMAMDDLHKGSYTGQFGFVYVEGAADAGRYDQELFLALRDWEPFFTGTMEDDDDDSHDGPLLEKPATMNTDPDGLEVGSVTYSINDKALGSGEPIRVREGQRVLIHFLNASAIENRRIALAGHRMKVIALDGNPVPTPQTLDSVFIGAGERVDVVVEMNHPGVWVLGSTEGMVRKSGLGAHVEYAGQRGPAQWIDPQKAPWDYTVFGTGAGAAGGLAAPQQIIDLTFEKIPGGAGRFNAWLVNGKPYPHEREFVLEKGTRYRLVMHNRTDDAHPMHLHRHLWELAEINGKKSAGVIKDTVVVPYYGRAIVDFTADQPGLSLFHCHIQQHMDYGFKALFRYA